MANVAHKSTVLKQGSGVTETNGIGVYKNSTHFQYHKAEAPFPVILPKLLPTKSIGNFYAYEIWELFYDNTYSTSRQYFCEELNILLNISTGGIFDSNSNRRIGTYSQYISATFTTNVNCYIADLGAFVQANATNFNNTVWRGNITNFGNTISSISASMRIFGTSLPTTFKVVDRPFVLLDISNNVLGIYKVSGETHDWVLFDPASKLRMEEAYNTVGTTAERPVYFIPKGFPYYDTDTGKRYVYDGTNWIDLSIYLSVIKYSSDLSGSFDSRSLIDKGFAEGRYARLTEDIAISSPQTSASLNALYPNANTGNLVSAPNITTLYIKTSSGSWVGFNGSIV